MTVTTTVDAVVLADQAQRVSGEVADYESSKP